MSLRNKPTWNELLKNNILVLKGGEYVLPKEKLEGYIRYLRRRNIAYTVPFDMAQKEYIKEGEFELIYVEELRVFQFMTGDGDTIDPVIVQSFHGDRYYR